jgi:hypothetical protein
MNMKSLTKDNSGQLALVALFVIASFLLLGSASVSASAPSGLPATIATSSNPTVTTSAALVFATSTACASRVITTYASPVMITFTDRIGQTPTGTFGHLQPASSTVAYDSGLYGCGAVKIYSFATQAITVSEGR